MRTLLVTFALLAAACGAKKSPQSPSAPPGEQEAVEHDSEMPDEQRPDDPDDAVPDSMVDPDDGGE